MRRVMIAFDGARATKGTLDASRAFIHSFINSDTKVVHGGDGK